MRPSASEIESRVGTHSTVIGTVKETDSVCEKSLLAQCSGSAVLLFDQVTLRPAPQ